MALQHAERLSLVERVIDQLRTQITAGSWECGERIPYRAPAQRHARRGQKYRS